MQVAIAVQQEVEARVSETDSLRRKHVERAQYEAELARRRFMKVDPENRLVADTLEAEWNNKLSSLAEAQEQYERQTQKQRMLIDISEAREHSIVGRASPVSGTIRPSNLASGNVSSVFSSKM